MFMPFYTTGIGSLPHKNAEQACKAATKNFDIPFWPQLPKLSFREWMIPQYSEGMPFVKINPRTESIWIDRTESDELDRFYETYTEESKIAISEDYAQGLHTFIKTAPGKFAYLKGHVVGPLTFTLGLRDKEGKPIYFDEELREIALMLLKAKIRWQMEVLRPFGKELVMFIDEPILSSIGSTAYLGVDPKEALRLLKEMTNTIKKADGISGIHCCGNADWSLVTKSGVDIISFDAYEYFDTILAYSYYVNDFMYNKGYLAWGIVPTSDALAGETFESIKTHFVKRLDKLSKKVMPDLIFSQILLTPSCGLGARTPEEAELAFKLLAYLKKTFTL